MSLALAFSIHNKQLALALSIHNKQCFRRQNLIALTSFLITFLPFSLLPFSLLDLTTSSPVSQDEDEQLKTTIVLMTSVTPQCLS